MSQGGLILIPTPIGNLQDLTPRALETLRSLDVLACEDTRHTQRLLAAFNLKVKLISFHAGSNPEKILHLLVQGSRVGLVSDAGMPCISDPGSILVDRVHHEGFLVQALPGPSALITALAASGFPANHFEFLGFMPNKKGREKLLKAIISNEHTVVLYESTHRIVKFLNQAAAILPKRTMVLAREISKIHEEYLRGEADELLELLLSNPQKQKGEFVVIISSTKFAHK
jgi:16S rRNA (cytidine1402-2'-O)-methyltransferase